MSTRGVLEAFDRWRAARVPLVLVTVVETEGSTYTKAGHRILMTGAGEFQGLVSGGCLEGDLAEHARAVLASGKAELVTYDLRGEQDEIWGLGIGCNGAFRVLLQPLSPEDGYQPFNAMAAALYGNEDQVVALVVSSDDASVPPGAAVTVGPDAVAAWRVPEPWQHRLVATCRRRMSETGAALCDEKQGGATLSVLYSRLQPLPWLLVLGAGLDAVPLVEIARRLGWRVQIADHRPAHLVRGDFGPADVVRKLAPGEISSELQLDDFAAAVVMTHHLASDRDYLHALAQSKIPYVGLLGPPARRDRLLAELGADAGLLQARLHSPAGLAIGADSPESIALAILAEIQTIIQATRGAR